MKEKKKTKQAKYDPLVSKSCIRPSTESREPRTFTHPPPLRGKSSGQGEIVFKLLDEFHRMPKFVKRKPMILFVVIITLPVYKVFPSSTMFAFVVYEFNLILFFSIDCIRRRSKVRIVERVEGRRVYKGFQAGNMEGRMDRHV